MKDKQVIDANRLRNELSSIHTLSAQLLDSLETTKSMLELINEGSMHAQYALLDLVDGMRDENGKEVGNS